MIDSGIRSTVARWFALGSLVLGAVFLTSLIMGAVAIPLSEVYAWATGQLAEDDLSQRVLNGIRLPRSLAALIVGATLGVCGAALQGIHRSRVIDSHLIGMSAAAGLGVAIGFAAFPKELASTGAVGLGMAFGAIYAVSIRHIGSDRTGQVGFVLLGVASGLAITAWIGLFVLAIDSPAVPSLSFFLFGSMAGVTWTLVGLATPVAIGGIVYLWWIGPELDVLALGEQTSIHLGFDARTRVPIVLAVIGVLTGASVAVAGVIGFVGLIVPLVVRPLIGSIHRLLIPASAIGGATVLLAFDIGARTIASPTEVPIGLLSAAVGGPVLVWLIRRDITG